MWQSIPYCCSMCSTTIPGTCLAAWQTSAGWRATATWSTAPCAMGPRRFCLRVLLCTLTLVGHHSDSREPEHSIKGAQYVTKGHSMTESMLWKHWKHFYKTAWRYLALAFFKFCFTFTLLRNSDFCTKIRFFLIDHGFGRWISIIRIRIVFICQVSFHKQWICCGGQVHIILRLAGPYRHKDSKTIRWPY